MWSGPLIDHSCLGSNTGTDSADFEGLGIKFALIGTAVETAVVIYWDRPDAGTAAALVAKPIARSFSNAKALLKGLAARERRIPIER